MKYMTFNNSCSYACLANMLEDYHMDYEDFDIIKEAKLSYIYYCSEEDYYTGPLLQSKMWFDLFLNNYNLEYIEKCCSKTSFLELLRKAPKTLMVGLNLSTGKHAMVFKGEKDQTYEFLNPHRKNDNQADYLSYNEVTLSNLLDDEVIYGYIQENKQVEQNIELYQISLPSFRKYRTSFFKLYYRPISVNELKDNLDKVFKPFFLTTLNMMEIVGNKSLFNKIQKLQTDLLNLIRSDKSKIVLSGYLDYKQVTEAFDEYENLIIKELNI